MQTHHLSAMAEAIATHIRSEYGLPVETMMVIEPLREYWDAFAVHIWSVEDVLSQARQNGWPMCEADAQEILADIEDNVDSERGITWQTLSDAVDAWCEGIRWAELSDEQMEAFEGHFIIVAGEGRVPVAGTLLAAVSTARALAAQYHAEASVISIHDSLVGIPGAEEDGHVLLTLPEE
jgi:hypothetical protein